MKQGLLWTFSLGRGFGIPIKLHWSFLAFLAWIALSEFSSSGQPLSEVIFVVLLFGCIVLHEFGHALMARYYNIKTRDITLYPIGGVAMLEREPKPAEELFIALAGPFVTLLIALLLLISVGSSGQESLSKLLADETGGSLSLLNLPARLFIANLVLLVFNLIPAFPMDGGRALRALLSLTIGERKANLVAARLAQVMSVAFLAFGFWIESPGLVVIGVLVFLNASQAQLSARTRVAIVGKNAGEIMVERDKLVLLKHGMTVQQAALSALKSLQDVFPVIYAENVIGVVSKSALYAAHSQAEPAYIAQYMTRQFLSVEEDRPLSEIVTLLESSAEMAEIGAVMVTKQEKFSGMISQHKLLDLIMLYGLPDNSISQEGKKPTEPVRS